jgi:acetyltransferase AlgX (SGNH hydrolase-like protein)
LFYVPTKFRVFRGYINVPPDSAMRSWDDWHQLPVRFKELCGSTGVPCVDLTSQLRSAVARGELPYAARDTHWSPQGHELVAAAVEAAIKGSGW